MKTINKCCDKLSHIVGSAFSVELIADASPITEGGAPVSNVAVWGVALVLVSDTARVVVAGSWLDAGAWTMLFEQSDTSAWRAGGYAVRLRYTAPDLRVFEEETGLIMEVKP